MGTLMKDSCTARHPSLKKTSEIIRKRVQGRDGFTVIELIVVVAIVGLLAALLLPAIGVAQNMAKTMSCMSRQRQIGMYFTAYLNDSNGQFPRGGTGFPNFWHQTITGIKQNTGGDITNLFMCPADNHRSGSIPWTGAPLNTAWRDGYISQGYNQGGLGPNNATESPLTDPLYDNPAYEEQIVKPSETLLVSDEMFHPLISTYAPAGWGYAKMTSSLGVPAVAYPRHNGKRVCNILWVDGHVSSVTVAVPGDFNALYDIAALGNHPLHNSLDTKWDRK